MSFERMRRREDESQAHEQEPARAAPSSATQVLALQQSAGNAAVARMLAREEGAPATAAQAPPAGAKTADLTLSAVYKQIAGTGRDKVADKDGNDALFFDPLTMYSHHPTTQRSAKARGVTAGGETTVDVYPAPVSGKGVGRGSISAQLKYSGQLLSTFDVSVANAPRAAVALAKKALAEEVDGFGDLETIKENVQSTVREVYEKATVSISVNQSKVKDAGQSTFYYRVRGGKPGAISMNVQAVPVGEEKGTYTGSKSASKSRETETSKRQGSQAQQVDVNKDVKDSERKTAVSTEIKDVKYASAVVRTLTEAVSELSKLREETATNLVKEIFADGEWKKSSNSRRASTTRKTQDYTRDLEKGTKDRSNWAAKLEKGIQGLKRVVKIPWLESIPLIGKYVRKVKGWQLDVASWLANQFAETGTVDYENEKISSTTDGKDTEVTSSGETVTTRDKTKLTEELTKSYVQETSKDWEHYLKDVTTVQQEYREIIAKASAEARDAVHSEDMSARASKQGSESSERVKTTESDSSGGTFSVTHTKKYTSPVIVPKVVGGDVEVAPAAFEPEAEE